MKQLKITFAVKIATVITYITMPEMYSDSYQRPKMECFAKNS